MTVLGLFNEKDLGAGDLHNRELYFGMSSPELTMATCLVSGDGEQQDSIVLKTVKIDQLLPLLALSDERSQTIVKNSLLFADLKLFDLAVKMDYPEQIKSFI